LKKSNFLILRFQGLLSVPFNLGKHNCSLVQSGENYELRIDSMVFNHLMELEKSKNLFSGGNDPVSNSYKPSADITTKVNKPSFGIGEIKTSNKQQEKPMFNFSIKNEGTNNQAKFHGKFSKIEDKKQQPIYNSYSNQYPQENPSEIVNQEQFVGGNEQKKQILDLDDIFGASSQTEKNLENDQQNQGKFIENLFSENSNTKSKDYDFTFKEQQEIPSKNSNFNERDILINSIITDGYGGQKNLNNFNQYNNSNINNNMGYNNQMGGMNYYNYNYMNQGMQGNQGVQGNMNYNQMYNINNTGNNNNYNNFNNFNNIGGNSNTNNNISSSNQNQYEDTNTKSGNLGNKNILDDFF